MQGVGYDHERDSPAGLSFSSPELSQGLLGSSQATLNAPVSLVKLHIYLFSLHKV